MKATTRFGLSCWVLSLNVVVATEMNLGQRFQWAQTKFEQFFKALDKATLKTLDYDRLVGTQQDRSTTLPSTPYAQFQHARRSYKVMRPKQIASLAPAVKQALGTLADLKQPSLISVINALTEHVKSEKKFGAKLSFWLGCSPVCPEDTLPLSLPDALKGVLAPLFDPWRASLTYSEEPNEEHNLFVLSQKLAGAIGSKSSDEQQQIQTWLGPLGTLDEDDPQTLFGKVIAAQRLVEAVIEEGLPFSYAVMQKYLAPEEGLIGQSFRASLAFLNGEADTPPAQSPQKLLAALCDLPKQTLRSFLIPVADLWPPAEEPESLQQRLQRLADRLEELSYLQKHPDLLKIQTTIGRLAKKSYAYGSLLDALTTLSNLINHSSLPFTEESFKETMPYLGNVGEASTSTLWGLLELVTQKLSKPTETTWQEVLGLLGTPEDSLARLGEATTIWGLLNALFENFLRLAPFPGQNLQDLVHSIAEREDLPLHLKPLLVGNDSMALTQRLQRLEAELNELLSSHTFGWADRLFDALALHVPALQKNLERILTQPASELSSSLGQVWWSSDSALQDLNALLVVLRCGGAQKLFQTAPSSSLVTPPWHLSLRTFDWYRKEWKTLLDKPLLEEVDFARQLGISSASTAKGFLEPVQTLWQRLQFLQETLPFVALDEAWSAQDSFSAQSWTQQIVTPETGLIGLFYLLNLDLNALAFHGSSSEALLRKRIAQALEESSPEVGTLSSLLQTLLEKGVQSYYQLTVDPIRAQQHCGWLLQDYASLRQRMRELRTLLRKKSGTDVLKALRHLGEDADNPFSPTLFGQLAACENFLFQLWEERLHIPLESYSYVVARLHESIFRLLKEGWTEKTLARLGDFLDPPSEDSLAGLLNLWRARVLAAPLETCLEKASERLQELTQNLATHPALKESDRLRVLLRLVPLEQLASLTDIAAVPSDFDATDETFSEALRFYTEALKMMSGTLQINQTRQWGDLCASLLTSLESLCQDFSMARKAFDPIVPIYKPQLADAALERIGTARDLFEATLASSTTRPSTLFGLVHNADLRLYACYTSFQSFLTSEKFQSYNNTLFALSESFFPNTTPLTPFILMSERCALFLSRCAALLETLAGNDRQAWLASCDDSLFSKKHEIFEELYESLWRISSSGQLLAKVLPNLWKQGADAQAIDLMPFVDDVLSGIRQSSDTFERLMTLLGISLPPESLPRSSTEVWDKDALFAALDSVGKAIQRVAEATLHEASHVQEESFYLPDFFTTSTDTARCAFVLRRLLPPFEDLYEDLRDVGQEELARFSSRIPNAIINLAEAVSLLGHAFGLQGTIQPLQTMHDALSQAYTSDSGRSLVDIIAGRSEETPNENAHGPVPMTLAEMLESQRQSLAAILPSYLRPDPVDLAEKTGDKFPL